MRTARPRLGIARHAKRAAAWAGDPCCDGCAVDLLTVAPHASRLTHSSQPQLTPAAARRSFSHGSYEYHGEVIANARQSQVDFPMDGKPVAIALDTKGPEIRTGMLVGDDVELVKGSTITVHTADEWKEKCDAEHLHMDYKNICNVS